MVVIDQLYQELEVQLYLNPLSALIQSHQQSWQFWLQPRNQVIVTDDGIKSVCWLESDHLLVSCETQAVY